MRKIVFILFIIPCFLWSQVSTSFYPNGIKKAEGVTKDGVKLGIWKSWYDTKQLSDSGEYVLLTKDCIRFYNDSNYTTDTSNAMLKTMLKNWINKSSIEKGKWVSYYKNGKIKQIGNYIPVFVIHIDSINVDNGDGNMSTAYSVPTSPYSEKTGIWKYYNENGKLESEEKYDDTGKLLEQKDY